MKRDRENILDGSNLRNGSVHARPVLRRILITEDQTTGNATDTAKSNQCGTAERASPLTTHIIRLVRHARRNIRICTCDREKDTCVPHRVALGKSHHGQADDAEQAVANEDWSADFVSVTDPGCAIHNNAGEDVWRGHKALRLPNVELHTFHQDDGEEIGDCVGDCSQAAVEC